MVRNRLEQFGMLASEARLDVPPAMDVSRQVLYRINALDEGIDRPLAWLTAGSFAMAACAMIMATTLYGDWNDPLAGIFGISPVLGL